MANERRLKTVLESGTFVLAPGVFDMFSAKIADRIGFPALYMAGYGVSGLHLAVNDAGLITYRDMVERARTIVEGTVTPLIADADTGFGGFINVRQIVRGYQAAGVQAVQIEDQEMPKKCGHAEPPRHCGARHVPQDRGRSGDAHAPRYVDRRPHRCAHRPRSYRGDQPPEGLLPSRR
jgi:2-methylisocitrate lyase-like PEP mutase family enzyme